MRQRGWIFIVLALILTACGGAIPIVTPTVAPTNTPLPTSVALEATDTATLRPTNTATPTPRPTNTPIPTNTATHTATATVTLTGTQTPTNTPTATATFTLTPTNTPSNTPTETPSPTDTDVPTPTPIIFASSTPTPSPSNTATLTATTTPVPSSTATNTPTNTATFTATFTNTPNFEATANAEALLTRAAASDTPLPPTSTTTPDLEATANAELLLTRAAATDTPVRATFTAVAQASATNTLIPPTLNVTPTFITATANAGIIPTPIVEFTPVESTPIVDFNAPTATATPFNRITPSPFPIDQIPATVQVQVRDAVQVLAPTFNNTTTTALTFNVGAGQFFFNGEALGGGSGVRLFSVNPADPNSFARTDSNGFLTFRPIGGGETPINTSPFYNGFSVSSASTNENFVNDISWSPNGQRFAFIVQPASGTDNVNAGVWFWDAGSNSTGTLLHDCPFEGYTSCDLTSRPVGNWQSIDVEWSPNSAAVVITANLTTEGRQGIFISNMNFATRRPEAPPFVRWDNAQWLNNAQLLVSGRSPDGRSLIATYNIQSGAIDNLIFDASANGLFIFDAVQRPNGQIVAIGREGGASDGAYRMYRIDNGVATPISGYVGNSPPQAVNWSANYSEAVLTVDGQQVIVNAGSGSVNSAIVSGNVQVGPGFSTNASGETVIQAPPPSGVVADSRYSAGQQIQYIGEIPRNMRIQPDVSAAFADIVNPTEFVTILAGPYESGGYEWWQISNSNGTRAWMSVRTLDGFSFFNP